MTVETKWKHCTPPWGRNPSSCCNLVTWQYLPPVDVERLLFISTHQVNVELGYADGRQFAQFLLVRIHIAQQAKTVYDFVGNEICVIACDLAMVLIVIMPAVLHVRSQRRGQILWLVLANEIHDVV